MGVRGQCGVGGQSVTAGVLTVGLVSSWSSVLVMVDVADKWASERLDLEVLKVLAEHPEVPAVLVLNKVGVARTGLICRMKVH